MTLAALIRDAARQAYATQLDARKVLDAALAAIAEAVKRGETVAIPDFGTFYPKRHKARRISGPPNTELAGKTLALPSTRTIGFRAARAQKTKTRAPSHGRKAGNVTTARPGALNGIGEVGP